MKSTPQAARKLLHLFACGLIVGLLAGSFVYLRAVFNEEVFAAPQFYERGGVQCPGFFRQPPDASQEPGAGHCA